MPRPINVVVSSLIGLLPFIPHSSTQTQMELRDPLVGTWKLVSAEETMKDGTTRPFPSFGPRAQGFLMYQRNGYMCAELANPDRPKLADPSRSTPEDRIAVAEGSFAYCGRYEVDTERNWIVHLPEVASDPAYIGSRQIRPYHFEGGRLVLGDVERNDPAVARWKIVWEKVP